MRQSTIISFMTSYPKSGGPIQRIVPPGDNKHRLVCEQCGYIQYDNPKIVVGVVATWKSKILLCKRAIEPRTDYWTLPAGYLELNENTEDGAKREAKEEAGADLKLNSLLAVYNIQRLSQVQIIYKACLLNDTIAPGIESKSVKLFSINDIPWESLAFPSVSWAIKQHDSVKDLSVFPPFTNPRGERGNY